MTTDTTTLVTPQILRIIRKTAVLDRVGCSDQHLTNMEERGQFPRRVQTGLRSVGWLEHEVNDWIAEKMRQREDAAKVEEQRIGRMPPAVRHRYRREREDDTVPA
jgi:prophage regulatory protein